MMRLFRKKTPIDSQTLTALVQPRYSLIDAKHKALIEYLSSVQALILDTKDTDKDIDEKLKINFNKISSVVEEYVINILNQPEKVKNKYPFGDIWSAMLDLKSNSHPATISPKEQVNFRFTHLINLIDEATITAKEQVSLAAINSIQNPSHKISGFGRKK